MQRNVNKNFLFAGKISAHLRFQYGLSLFEVVISLLILSFVLLTLARFQVTSIRHVYSEFLVAVAQTQLQSMCERIRADQNNLGQETRLWNQSNQFLLPEAEGKVSGTGPWIVELSWFDPQSHKFLQLTHEVAP